jgi:hypothetical protein
MALGYGISSVFEANNIEWYYGFFIQCALMVCVAAMFLLIPSELFSHEHEALVENFEESVPNASIK